MNDLNKEKKEVGELSILMKPLDEEKQKSVEDFMNGFTKALELIGNNKLPKNGKSNLKTG